MDRQSAVDDRIPRPYVINDSVKNGNPLAFSGRLPPDAERPLSKGMFSRHKCCLPPTPGEQVPASTFVLDTAHCARRRFVSSSGAVAHLEHLGQREDGSKHRFKTNGDPRSQFDFSRWVLGFMVGHSGGCFFVRQTQYAVEFVLHSLSSFCLGHPSGLVVCSASKCIPVQLQNSNLIAKPSLLSVCCPSPRFLGFRRARHFPIRAPEHCDFARIFLDRFLPHHGLAPSFMVVIPHHVSLHAPTSCSSRYGTALALARQELRTLLALVETALRNTSRRPFRYFSLTAVVIIPDVALSPLPGTLTVVSPQPCRTAHLNTG
ncbi:hypothetical protein C8Q78DRAFT_61378 [Trametes maxima]|nr:hypothetical protein C8Q78DRAFT_61378 [Trametes maxima]